MVRLLQLRFKIYPSVNHSLKRENRKIDTKENKNRGKVYPIGIGILG